MFLSFALETQATALPVVIGLMMLATVGMCATWPALEALVSDGEPPARLQGLLGTYNVIWAIASAFAYFTGGAMIQHWGWTSMFLVPAGLQGIEFSIALWIHKHAPRQPVRLLTAAELINPITHKSIRSPVSPQTFLKMALLSNPFAYLAINTVVSVMPTLAGRLGLNTAQTRS